MNTETKPNKIYLFVVLALMLIFPVLSILMEWMKDKDQSISISLIGKWFIFWSVGVRLFIAGLRQVIDPSFTAKTIFHIESKESHVLVKELGFANICAGIIGILSLCFPGWRIVSAVASGLYYGLAGITHLIKKPAGANERIALVSDIFIFLLLLIYAVYIFNTAAG